MHESGHALVAALCEHADPVAKVTISPMRVSASALVYSALSVSLRVRKDSTRASSRCAPPSASLFGPQHGSCLSRPPSCPNRPARRASASRPRSSCPAASACCACSSGFWFDFRNWVVCSSSRFRLVATPPGRAAPATPAPPAGRIAGPLRGVGRADGLRCAGGRRCTVRPRRGPDRVGAGQRGSRRGGGVEAIEGEAACRPGPGRGGHGWAESGGESSV
nr:hypothetical protein [Streptomyces sp. TLI_235]